MFAKMFKLCLCESGKNFKLCLCTFFYLPPFVSKCHTLPKVLSDGPSNSLGVLQIGRGGGGGGGGEAGGGGGGGGGGERRQIYGEGMQGGEQGL
jgi:hypothetical protein